jgi:hypothetical protein
MPFLPVAYQGEMYTDYAAMRHSGLLDRLERLPMMSTFLDELAAAYGCDLDDLQRVRTALVFDGEGTRSSIRMLSVAELAPDATASPPDATAQAPRTCVARSSACASSSNTRWQTPRSQDSSRCCRRSWSRTTTATSR